MNQNPKSSLVMPSQKQNGLDNHADAEPVIAKTIKINVNWKLLSIPQRSFNFFILKCQLYKYTKIIVSGHCQIAFAGIDFGNKSYNCRLNNSLRIHNLSVGHNLLSFHINLDCIVKIAWLFCSIPIPKLCFSILNMIENNNFLVLRYY